MAKWCDAGEQVWRDRTYAATAHEIGYIYEANPVELEHDDNECYDAHGTTNHAESKVHPLSGCKTAEQKVMTNAKHHVANVVKGASYGNG